MCFNSFFELKLTLKYWNPARDVRAFSQGVETLLQLLGNRGYAE